MSSDLSQLIHLFGNLGHGQNTQILSVSGTANQTSQPPNEGAPSSDGTNASQIFQVANSNIHQIIYNLNLGNSNLGARAIANGDHGAHPDHQDSHSTVVSYASQSTIEASNFIGSNSVQNVQLSDLSADQEDLNAKLAAVKESTVEVRKSTEELKASNTKLVERIAKYREWIIALDWPTFLGLVSGADVTLGNLVVEQFISMLKLSLTILEFGQLSVEHGESTVRDSDSMSMTTVGKSISPIVFVTLTLKLGKAAATFKESRERFGELFIRYMETITHFDTTGFTESARALDPEDSGLKKFMKAVNFNTFGETVADLKESNDTVSMWLVAFSESMVAYAKSLCAPDNLIAAFSRD